jgi:hypothetical protein
MPTKATSTTPPRRHEKITVATRIMRNKCDDTEALKERKLLEPPATKCRWDRRMERRNYKLEDTEPIVPTRKNISNEKRS